MVFIFYVWEEEVKKLLEEVGCGRGVKKILLSSLSLSITLPLPPPSLFVSLCLCLSFSLSLNLSISLYLCVSLSLSLPIYQSVFISLVLLPLSHFSLYSFFFSRRLFDPFLTLSVIPSLSFLLSTYLLLLLLPVCLPLFPFSSHPIQSPIPEVLVLDQSRAM